MSVIANPPFPSYFDSDGSPLEDGYIYFGAANQNPETNPITVYWDSAYTQPALQPIRTSGGFTYRAGTPANIYVSTDFSITVRDKNRRLVYSKLLSEGQTTAEVNLQYSTQAITATAAQTVFGLSTAYTPGNNSLAVYHNGSRLIVGQDYTETTSTSITLAIGATAGDVLQFVTATPINPSSLGAAAVAYVPAGAGAVATNVQAKLRETVSLIDFGAVGDGVTDDTAAIQAAFNAVSDGGSVYFPKTGGVFGPHYKITSGLTLSKNDVTLFSDPASEYTEGLVTTNAITMLTVTGYGLRMSNLCLTGNGDSLVFGTSNGLVIDRSSNGDAETYSNLDASITNCLFFRLNDAIRGKGRNVFVLDNTISECKRGVIGELHTYSGGTVSEFRGWRVSRNRFHSCGGQYINAASSVTLPASLALLDSWCIQMPQTSSATSHLEVFDNNTDFCGAGFYKGYLAGSKIAGNQTHGGSSIFVYADITDANNQSACAGFVQSIENNSINSRTADQTTDRGYLFSSHSLYVTNVANLTIQNNVMRQCVYQHLIANACDRLRINNNTFLNGNNLFFQDSTTRSCVAVTGGNNLQFMGNFIASQLGNVYGSAFIASGTTNFSIKNNTVLNATQRYSIAATELSTGNDEGLDWQTPSMLNSFTLGALSRGYRRRFDGTVEIDIQVSAGTDNTAAFQLPAGYRPSVAIGLPAVSIWTDGSDAYAQIETNGNVVVNWNTAAATSYNIRHQFTVA